MTLGDLFGIVLGGASSDAQEVTHLQSLYKSGCTCKPSMAPAAAAKADDDTAPAAPKAPVEAKAKAEPATKVEEC